MKFLTDFTYRSLHGFAQFPGDSTALVLFTNVPKHACDKRFRWFPSKVVPDILHCSSNLLDTILLGGELLAERCRTDDLIPSIPISCLPPCCTDPKVQGLDILIYCSQPGSSWATNGPPPVRGWS